MPAARTKATTKQAKRAGGRRRKANTASATLKGERQPRERSAAAGRGIQLFAELRRFFEHNAQLAEALGWDEATVAQWRDAGVVRPQRAKVAEVALLSELCLEARPYLRADKDVGRWLSAPLPNLQGHSPGEWLRERRGRGLIELTHGLIEWMPRLPAGEVEPIDEQAASRTLKKAAESDDGVREVQRMLAQLD